MFKSEEFDKSLLPPFLKNIHLSDSVNQIISILGGVNIQLLKNENRRLKENNGILHAEIEKLRDDLGLKEAYLDCTGISIF